MSRFGSTEIQKLFSLFVSLFLFFILHMIFPHGSSASPPQLVVESKPLLHTFVEIKAYGENARKAIDEAFSEIERVNALLNNYDNDSEVSQINKQAGLSKVSISCETMEALRLAKKYGDISRGALDISIGPLLKLWGFAQEEAGLNVKEPDIYATKHAKSLVDYNALELIKTKNVNGSDVRTARLKKKGMWIDVGAISKGYVADRAVNVLKKHGIEHALISAGGTICAIGEKANQSLWRVGIKHPRKPESYLAVVFIKDKSVSTSGDYEKFYKRSGKRFTHIIDPRTGMPVEKMQSVTVIAGTGFESDALSTSLFVLGPVEGIKLINSMDDVEALIVSKNGGIFFSEGWPEKKIFY